MLVVSAISRWHEYCRLPELKAEFMVPSIVPSLNTDDNNKKQWLSYLLHAATTSSMTSRHQHHHIITPYPPGEQQKWDDGHGNACQIISSAEIDEILRQPELEQAESMVPKDISILLNSTMMPLMTKQNNDSNNFVHVNNTSAAKHAISSVQNLDGTNTVGCLNSKLNSWYPV